MNVTIGVYADNTYKHNIVSNRNLAKHIEYNKTVRFGRALFVNGKCVHNGYLDRNQIKQWTKLISKMVFDKSKEFKVFI